jgi:hypothetical protein
MKPNALQTFLDDCRKVQTSDELGDVLKQIEAKITAARGDWAKLDGQLQEAIVAGRDASKIHAAIAQTDQDTMTLEAALADFSQRQSDLQKQEAEATAKALVARHVRESQQLGAAAKDLAATVETARVAAARVAELAKQHSRTGAELEASKLRPASVASAIIRGAIGEVRRGDGVSEYGRRIDITLAEVLEMNPGQMMRARDTRRQRGRFGETTGQTDHRVEAILTQTQAR